MGTWGEHVGNTILRPGASGDAASTPVFGMLVAGAVVLSAIAAGVSILAQETRMNASQDGSLDAKAQDVLTLIVTETGRGAGGAADWDSNPDLVERFGLASSKGRNFLSGDKIETLRHGRTEEATNTHPDYPEVRRALGLEDHDFHLRSYPLVYRLDDERFNKFRGLNAAYIGEFVSATTPEPAVDVTITATEDAGRLLVSFTVDCVAPLLSSSFPDVLLLTTKLKTGNSNGYGTIIQNHYSPVIDCSTADSETVHVRYERMDLKSYSGAWSLQYDLKSIYANRLLRDKEEVVLALTDGTESYTVTAEPDSHNFWSTGAGASAPVILLDKVKTDGTRYEDAAVVVDITVTEPGGAVLTYEDIRIPPTASLSHALTGLTATTNLETFVVEVASANATGTAAQHTHFTYTTTEKALPTMQPSDRAEEEISGLEGLVESFDRDRYRDDSDNVGLGDVYRDVVQDTRQTLAEIGDRILWEGRDGVADTDDDYDLLIVGSGVKGSALSGEMADSMRDWVEEGNTLLVLGVDENNAQWLRSTFEIKLITASGSISAPDPTHPALTSPEELNYRSYDNEGRQYEMTGDVYDGFSHVLVASSSNSASYDMLAISNPGVYGDGTVILSSFIPLTMTDDDSERLKFMNNMLTQSLNEVMIDFGPAIPSGIPVGSSARLVVVPHPQDPTLLMELKLVLYVW